MTPVSDVKSQEQKGKDSQGAEIDLFKELLSVPINVIHVAIVFTSVVVFFVLVFPDFFAFLIVLSLNNVLLKKMLTEISNIPKYSTARISCPQKETARNTSTNKTLVRRMSITISL